MGIVTIGMDLAKNVFAVHRMDAAPVQTAGGPHAG
jgi:hypothetical protein